MADSVIEVQGLHKQYGEVEAVRGIDLNIERGEVFALLGPNGAGKTTTVEILEGHRTRSAGQVRVLGFDPERNEVALKQRTGIVLQRTGLEPYLTVAETIDMFRGYYPQPLPLDEVLEVVGLKDQRTQRVRRLSGGQQRRLDVAVGLAGDPELLFLDEPTTGFDPTARRGAWTMIRNLRERGKTILLTTHYLDEAQELADRVAIMMNGEIVAEDTPSQLVSADSHTSIRFRIPEEAQLPGKFELQTDESGQVEIRTTNLTQDLHTLTSWAIAEEVSLTDLTVSRLSLEEVFLQLTDKFAEKRENSS
ncbi:MAG: ABC transporter [Dehalococcoidia bacterium]|nr:ABC transporter [Dehalococcoidia bacterium]|tara:strand:- start:15490 stop:16407 length:918 start_codon:yes stop_codon:yes gene_type:complete